MSDITDDLPPDRSSYIEVSYGPGEFDKANSLLIENTERTSRALGLDLGVATNAIVEGAEISIRIRELNDYIPIVLGWREVEWDGSAFTYSDHETDLGLTAETFPYDDTSGGTYTYRDQFRIWRKLPS